MWILSEPPDIRNWFPSYEYESPVLDSNENFGDSVSKEIQFAKSDLIIEEGDREKEENPGGLKKIRKRDEEFVSKKLCSNGFVNCSSFLGSDKLEGPSLNKVLFLDALWYSFVFVLFFLNILKNVIYVSVFLENYLFDLSNIFVIRSCHSRK